MRLAVLVTILWQFFPSATPAQTWVALETGVDGKTSVSGDQKLLAGSYPPASTFKLLIAWAALQEGVAGAETLHACADRGGKKIGMAEAMYFSSNDYFRWLALRLEPKALEALIHESGWADSTYRPGVWRGAGGEGAERGGELKVTVTQVHHLMRKLLAWPRGPVAEGMRTVMRRPWNDPASQVYGKSGAWGGAVWMTGYRLGANPGETKVVTVFVPYETPHWKPAREKAQTEFYRLLGLPRPKE